MKKCIISFIAGLVTASTIAFAASYVAEPADFKVLVNGKEFASDPPALVVNGSTYLPLRAMGNALGVPVNWNDELQQAEVGSSPIAETVGANYSRNNPAPINTMQTHVQSEQDYGDSACTANVRVESMLRGEAALRFIKEDSKTNKDAPDGYEYIVAKLAVSAPYIKIDRSVTIDSFLFDCFTSNNEKYESSGIYLNDALDETMYEGGNGEGYLVFCVKKDDLYPKVAFALGYDGTGGIWFALYE